MLNNVVLMGRLTADVELRSTQNGKRVCSFCMAIDDGYGDNKRTYFIGCVAWEKTAEHINKYFNKGSLIAIAGKLTTRTYQDKSGSNRTATEVVVSSVSFTGEKKDSATKPSELALNEVTFSNDDDLPF